MTTPAASALSAPIEYFPVLQGVSLLHGFIGRVNGIDVKADRPLALARLDASHREARRALGLADRTLMTAEQVHGNMVVVIEEDQPLPEGPVPGADGLVTRRRDVCLGIYVADCCAVFLADPKQGVIGLVHSGKKGTELGIAPKAAQLMMQRFGSRPEDIVVQLSPCIRPPHYEVDFAAQIAADCRALGIGKVDDCGACTAANPDQYYSYRMEKGRTGRMLALLALP